MQTRALHRAKDRMPRSRARSRRPTRAHPGPCPGFRSISSRCESRDARECRLSRWLLHNSEAVGERHTNAHGRRKMGRQAASGHIRVSASHRTPLERVYATATAQSSNATRVDAEWRSPKKQQPPGTIADAFTSSVAGPSAHDRAATATREAWPRSQRARPLEGPSGTPGCGALRVGVWASRRCGRGGV
jgi:hypothetical protein